MLKLWKAGPSGSPMISNGESLMKTRLCLLFATVAFFSFSETYSLAQDYSTLRERVLQMSHSTRIDDAGMKPWHMKAKFQLYDEKGKPSATGTLEEWWAGPQLWKITIESPLYTATTIENAGGDFRTAGVGPIPLQIRAIERDLVYPAPMGEDLSRTMPHVRHEQMESVLVDCIQLREATDVVQFPYYCIDSANVLRGAYSTKPWRMVREQIDNFQGRSVALSITVQEGKRDLASAEVADLTEVSLESGRFAPSPDMTRITNMHTLPVVRSK